MVITAIFCFVEGPSDKLVYQVWMKTLGYDCNRMRIYFIPMGGCGNALNFAGLNILKDPNPRFLIILDNDKHGKGSSKIVRNKIFKKHSYIKRTNRVVLLPGELENFFDLDAVSEVLCLPKEYIDTKRFRIDPKDELIRAARKARESGISQAKYYNEVRDAEKIASRMSRDEILQKREIRKIINRIVSMSGERIIK